MTLQKTTTPLVLLMMFTVLCALPVAGTLPSAIAQEEDEDLFPDDTNTEIAGPITDQDQGAANLGANLASNLDVENIIEETRPTTPTPPQEEEEQPEFEAFCNQLDELHCYDTFEDCVAGEEFIGDEDPECEGVETRPSDAGDCFVIRDEEGEVNGVTCFFI